MAVRISAQRPVWAVRIFAQILWDDFHVLDNYLKNNYLFRPVFDVTIS